MWTLGIASELLFLGDAGTTEASRPSRRTGIEWANYFRPVPWLTLDADIAASSARFTDHDPAGDRIPGAIETVISLGASLQEWRGLFGAARLRYFGPRPLVEDNSVRSNASRLVNAEIGYRLSRQLRLSVDIFNLLDARVTDIDYFYRSRLPGEPLEGVDDVHTHPAQPRSARLNLRFDFFEDRSRQPLLAQLPWIAR